MAAIIVRVGNSFIEEVEIEFEGEQDLDENKKMGYELWIGHIYRSVFIFLD